RRPRVADDVPGIALHHITRAVVRGAGEMAYDLKAKLVVVASHSGRTALALSQHRSFVPTIGVSTSEETLRQMCLYWALRPFAPRLLKTSRSSANTRMIGPAVSAARRRETGS